MLGRGGLRKYSLAPKRSLTSIHTRVCIACALNSAIAIACISLHKSLNNYASTSITKISAHILHSQPPSCAYFPPCVLSPKRRPQRSPNRVCPPYDLMKTADTKLAQGAKQRLNLRANSMVIRDASFAKWMNRLSRMGVGCGANVIDIH